MNTEHKTPLRRGGTDAPENTVPACSTCNGRKGLSTLEEYRLRLGYQSGQLPIVFACEAPPSISRDYLICMSPEFVAPLVAHNAERTR